MRKTVYVSNNSFDSVLLTENGKIISTWVVDPETLKTFLKDRNPDLWESHEINTIVQPRDFGEILAENGCALDGLEEEFNYRCRLYRRGEG
jgi:hypothetical protein